MVINDEEQGRALDVRIQGNRIIVAVAGFADDWAAYEDRVTGGSLAKAWKFDVSLEMKILDTARVGDKIGEEEAARLFPDWADRLVWRR